MLFYFFSLQIIVKETVLTLLLLGIVEAQFAEDFQGIACRIVLRLVGALAHAMADLWRIRGERHNGEELVVIALGIVREIDLQRVRFEYLQKYKLVSQLTSKSSNLLRYSSCSFMCTPAA